MKFEEVLPLMRRGEMVHQLSHSHIVIRIVDLEHNERKPRMVYAMKEDTGTWHSPVELSGLQILAEDWMPYEPDQRGL